MADADPQLQVTARSVQDRADALRLCLAAGGTLLAGAGGWLLQPAIGLILAGAMAYIIAVIGTLRSR